MNYPEIDLIVLHALLLNKQQALDFVGANSANLFDVSLWNIANSIVNYIKIYKDVPTLNILLDKAPNEIMRQSIKKILDKIKQTQYDEKEFKHNVEKLQRRFAVNQLTSLRSKLESMNTDEVNPKSVIKDIQQTVQVVSNLNKTKTYDRKTLKDSIIPFREEIAAKLANPDFDRGIHTRYSFIDGATDGLRPGELVIIGGETGAGKSMLLMNIALQMWMQSNTIDMVDNFKPGHNVLYFSLEMPFKSCRNRVYSRLSGVPTKLIKRPVNEKGQSRLNAEDRQKLKNTLQFIDKYPSQFEIIDIPRGATPEHLELLFEEAKAQYNPEIVVIDYLGLMELQNSNEDDWLKLGIIAGQVHEMCRTHNIIGLTAVQLNRTKASSKDAEDKIGSHRIGRSALILTHANLGLQIESRPNEKNYPDMIVHLIKVRDGEQGKGKLLKNLSCGTLLDNDESPEETTFTNVDDISEQIDNFDI